VEVGYYKFIMKNGKEYVGRHFKQINDDFIVIYQKEAKKEIIEERSWRTLWCVKEEIEVQKTKQVYTHWIPRNQIALIKMVSVEEIIDVAEGRGDDTNGEESPAGSQSG
jgi:hypothetical protein